MQKYQKTIQLEDEKKKELLEQIGKFAADELEMEIGYIREQKILDFFMKELAPIIYDQGLEDAKRWYRQMMEYLEEEYYSLYKS